MDKIKRAVWAKSVALVIATISFISAVGSIFLMILMSELPTEKQALDTVYENIADNYAASILHELQCGNTMEELQERLQDTLDPRLKYAVIRVPYVQRGALSTEEYLRQLDLGDPSIYLYGGPEITGKYRFAFRGTDNSYYHFNISSVSHMALYSGGSYSYENDYRAELVKRVIFLPQNGVFYYEAESGCYPVHTILIREKNDLDYESFDLQEENGELFYRSTDTGDRLSKETYPAWKYIRLESGSGVVRRLATTSGSLIEPVSDALADSLPETSLAVDNAQMDETDMEGEDAVRTEIVEATDSGSQTAGNSIYVLTEDESAQLGRIHGYVDSYISSSYLYHPNSVVAKYDYYVLSYVDESIESNGAFADAAAWIGYLYDVLPYVIPVEIISVVLFLGAFCFLMYAAGWHKGADMVTLTWLDKIWVSVITTVVVTAEALLIMLMFVLGDHWWSDLGGLAAVELELAVFAVLLGLGFCMTMAARLKAHAFWRYTAVYWCWHCTRGIWNGIAGRLRRLTNGIRKNTSLVMKTMLFLLAVSLIGLISLQACTDGSGGAAGWFFLAMLVVWPFCIWVALQQNRIKQGGERIAHGDLSNPIDTKGLFWEFKRHAENINKVSDNISLAVEKQMKSERFKTELITNVSHDIKTPLTSIINYVDLIKKEEITDPTLVEYLEVLDRQSSRLKKLIEDLMEASKASTGNLAVNLEACDARVLLTQVVGEFEEKAQANGLTMVISQPEEPVTVMFDGRHIWRVFENLLNNICKYALPQTRVYISLEKQGNEAVIIFRNISKSQLNISSEELMERFVRGDSSRNTEGSGLGLSIAQSLTNLMNGTMELAVDGDLFKVILRFAIAAV